MFGDRKIRTALRTNQIVGSLPCPLGKTHIGILRSDETGYGVKYPLYVQLELKGYGISRPQINGMWDNPAIYWRPIQRSVEIL